MLEKLTDYSILIDIFANSRLMALFFIKYEIVVGAYCNFSCFLFLFTYYHNTEYSILRTQYSI